MSDSRHDSADQERPKGGERGAERPHEAGRSASRPPAGKSSRDDRQTTKSAGDRGANRSASSGDRKSYGDRDRKPYGDRDSRSHSTDRDRKPHGDRDRKPYGDRDATRPYGDRDRKPYGDRDHKPYGDRDAKRPYGDRDATRPYGDRDAKRPHGDRDTKRPYGDRDRKPYGDRDATRPSGDRKPYGGQDRKPYGDRDAKRPYGDRDRKPYGDRDHKPYGDRDAKRPYGDRDAKRPHGDRDTKRPYGDRDRKPYGDRDATRPSGDRKPYGGQNRKPYGDRDVQRSHGDRDRKPSYSDRDRKPYGDRDGQRGTGDRDRKPYGDRDAKRPYGDRDAKRPYGDRDAKRPYGDRDARKPYGDRRGDDRSSTRDDDTSRERYGASDLAVRPRHDDPEIPERIQPRDLDKSARAELKTLSKENADWVARHLVAASELLDEDPELAHQHAMSAARRAGRIAVVRETLAITAYATGDFTLALREFRTYRRISGSNDQLPLMVDSERGVGRPDRALEVGRAVDRAELPVAVQVSLAIAMSGARLDLGQPELALAELEIPQLDPDRAFSYSPALFSAYAEVLEELGRTAESSDWHARTARAEAALGGPAEAEIVEIFEIEEEGEPEVPVEPGIDARSGAAPLPAPVDAEPEPEPETEVETEVESEPETESEHDDPGAVLEEDVAAVIAEGEALEAESNEDGGDGPVPSTH